ncbi:MAG TPA: magnesium-translocating P-type ATPase [Rudaea sp.]
MTASRWAAQPIGTALAELRTSPDGLSSAEAARRLARDGSNEALDAARRPLWKALAEPFANPLAAILLLSATVSGLAGDSIGATIIFAMVLLSGSLNFVLNFHSQRAAQRLREEIVPTATVRRDGAWVECQRRCLVVGDVVRLCAGDRVPADARVLTARDLHVQQAALTGESAPVEKEAVDAPLAGGAAVDAHHLVFLGTSVLAGTATAVVIATGKSTAFGDVAAALTARPPPTDFERGLDAFAKLILRTVLFLVFFVLLASAFAHRPALESVLFAVALAVGLTPEFMPMITTVTLARGAVRMARHRVIVKHLSAIDHFGSMDVLLCDKTGTLTIGAMALDASVDSGGAASERALRLAWLNSRFETGIRSPLNAAIIAHCSFAEGTERKIDEIPFDFERRRVSVVVADGSECCLITKGAPEYVLAQCTRHERNGVECELDADSKRACTTLLDGFGDRGLRAIAVASRTLPLRERYGPDDEVELTLHGFLTFADPPIPGIGAVLAKLKAAGIEVKILSGDEERVVAQVCGQIGLEVGTLVAGSAIDSLDERQLGLLAERTRVFARVLPAQKHRIVLALKQRGHVVGFLGDGINDAPSLHAADIGISVSSAVDVAKDAADIVLRERDLSALRDGVIEGRRAFANVVKYLLMGTSSNFGNVLSMALGVLFLPFLPMLPTQILLNNFLYDLAQVPIPTDRVDAAQLLRPQRWNIALIRRFMLAIGPVSSAYDLLTFYVLLRFMHASQELFHTGWFVESLATQTLVLFVIRTFGNPLRSRPSRALALSALTIVCVGAALPFTSLALPFGFVPLPPQFFAFLIVASGTYLLLVQWLKVRLLRTR